MLDELRNRKAVCTFEIVLLVTMGIAFSYMLSEAYKNEPAVLTNKDKIGIVDSLKIIYKFIVENLVGKGLVSALAASDLSAGAYTCLKDKNGSICQQYPSSECDSKCNSTCIPATRENVLQCKLGTCYDGVEGTCQTGSPKATCESSAGQWFDDPNGNVAQCARGCCILGQQTAFVTDRQCTSMASSRGFEKEFKPEVKTELQCLVLARSQEEGACVFSALSPIDKNNCKFTTKASCLQQNGDFRAGYLCSAVELNTRCEKQATTSCVEGLDEVYWFDSCGNKENIYSTNKVQSWNSGKVLSKNESCSIGTASNKLSNKATCGNCNYLTGSRCGLKTTSEKLADGSQNVVCRDLRCTDSTGKVRENGESWCAYQGAIGVDVGNGGLKRSIDTVGSRDFRQTCIDGKVQTDPCADYRNEICVENQAPKAGGGTFSTAACRLNLWQHCLEYNIEMGDKKGQALKEAMDERDNKCEKNPDCFIKSVKIDSEGFKFDMCAPKYPPGFNLDTNDDGASKICSSASQKCTVIYVKDMGGNWKCMFNCDCVKAKFTEQMNDFCMSLGDCGAKVNYLGDLDLGYGVKNAPKLGDKYLDKLKTYSEYNNSPNKLREAGNVSDFYGALGIPDKLGKAGEVKDPSKDLQMMSMISGIGGVGLAYAASNGIGMGVLSSLNLAGPTAGGAGGPGLMGAGGALAGAAIGFAVTALLIQYTGIGPGLDPAAYYGLLVAGTLAGAMAGYALTLSTAAETAAAAANVAAAAATAAAGTAAEAGAQVAAIEAATAAETASANAAFIGTIAIVLIVAVVIFIVVMALMGVGKMKKIIVKFSCYPWEAPNGGAKCNQCGKDGFPCSRYACNSLGQTCDFINEGTGNEMCIDISPNDVTPPKISPLESALLTGYSYTDKSDSGVKIKSNENDGCIKANQPMTFGIELNEPGQCKFDVAHKTTFDEMEFEFGDSTIYKYNHTQAMLIPDLSSLGLPGYDPNRRADYNLYIRCKDKSGNVNTNEYDMNFCLKPGEDLTAPVVVTRNPVQEYVQWNATLLNASIFTNEPADCKWDASNVAYDSMQNTFNCSNDLGDATVGGWECGTIFPVGTNDTSYYVKCKDQPWLSGVNESKRNTNAESYLFNVKKSKSALNIDYIKPNGGVLTFGTQPATVNVEAKTSGGVDGKAECFYKIGSQEIPFMNTFGTIHKQTFNQFTDGDKELNVLCKDVAGNNAEATAKFTISIDTDAPRVTRVFDNGGTLNVVTDESADCVYRDFAKRNSNGCNFEFSNGTKMTGVGVLHTAVFDKAIYYIKCKDQFGNLPGDCSIVVRNG